MSHWRRALFSKIDALNLRERRLLFISVIVVCLAIGDTLWLSPAKAIHQQLTARFQQQNAELVSLHAALLTDHGKAARDEISMSKVDLEKIDKAIEAVLPTASQRTRLQQVLVSLLRRHDKLTLLHVAIANRDASGYAADSSRTGNRAAGLPAELTSQGIELTLSGPYPELVRYLQTLETELPYIRWGTMNLNSDKLSPELSLQLFLVGVGR